MPERKVGSAGAATHTVLGAGLSRRLIHFEKRNDSSMHYLTISNLGPYPLIWPKFKPIPALLAVYIPTAVLE